MKINSYLKPYNQWILARTVFSIVVTFIVLAGTARADLVVLDDDFNDYLIITNSANPAVGFPTGKSGSYTNFFSNTNGIGGGFNVCNWSVSMITETNSLINLTGHNNGGDRNAIASAKGMPISSSGSTVEFTNVTFAANPITGPNGIDRLFVGLARTNDFFSNNNDGWQDTPPPGFYVQFESDSISHGGSGNANFDGNSVFFYRSVSGAKINLASWTFDTLNFRYSANGGNTNLFNFTPALDVKITIDGSHWHLQITGDTTGGGAIDFSGNYVGNFDGDVPAGEIINGYAIAFSQSSVNMSIDRVLMKQLGDFIVGTPVITTPGYPYNTNYVYAGEPVTFSDTASGAGALTYQWQQENPPGSSTYANIANATNLSFNLDTSALGDSQARRFQLVVSNSVGGWTNSSPVALTVAPATPPIIISDTTISPVATNYVGGQVSISAQFNGNHPIVYQWQRSIDGSVWNDIANATNTTLTLANLQADDGQLYRLVAVNSYNSTPSTGVQLTVLAGGQKYAWSAPVNYNGLTASQILLAPVGELAGAAMFGNGPVTVSLGSGQPSFVFLSDGSVASVTGAGNGFSGAFGTNTTGNVNFNTVLGGFNPDGNPKMLTLSNLVVGQQYSVQLFAQDYRNGVSSPRRVNFQDPNDSADVSVPFDITTVSSYVVGTFYASNTTETIQENLLDGGSGNLNALVLRAIGWNPPPYGVALASQIGYVGLDATFTVTAGSYVTPTYQWAAGPVGGPYTPLTEGDKYSGVHTASLTINNLATSDGSVVYVVTVTNPGGSVTSPEAALTVNNLSVTPALIGHWLAGGQNFTDSSGFTATGTHDGVISGANYTWSSDVPVGHSGYALHFGDNNSDTVVVITNTANTAANPGYLSTFDDAIVNSISVACWAKGFPSDWSPWVAKRGEDNIGYQLRRHGGDNTACFTVRGTTAPNGGDLQAALPSNDGQWHHYVGTYDASAGVQKIYVDGQLSVQVAATGPIVTAPYARLTIGGRDNNGADNSGGATGFESTLSNSSVYDVRVYNYALTPHQAAQLAYVPVIPTLSIGTSGSDLILNWSAGTLLEATNITGPWTTNNNTSPYLVTPDGPQKFFKVQAP